MRSSYPAWTLILLAIFSFGAALPALAQSDSYPASTSVCPPGHSVKSVSSETRAATKDSYYAAKSALSDTETTDRVKAALHRDLSTHSYDIDVTTTAGVVTLEGKVPSHDVAMRATQLAMDTEGVRGVKNRMVIISAAISPAYSRYDYSTSQESMHGQTVSSLRSDATSGSSTF
jgi:hypothetical protein